MFYSRRIATLEEDSRRLIEKVKLLERELTLLRNPSKFKIGDTAAYEGKDWKVVKIVAEISEGLIRLFNPVYYYISLYNDELKKTITVTDNNLSCK